jgi:hypothetical protein
MVHVGAVRHIVGAAGFVRQDSGHLARIVNFVLNRRLRQNAEVGVELVVDLGRVFEIITVPDPLEAHIARDIHALGSVNRDETRHGIVDGAVLQIIQRGRSRVS